MPEGKDCLTTGEGLWCHLQSTVIFYGTRSYWLGGAADLSRRQALAGDFSDWLMVKVMACAPSKGRGGSHDLNCPITIVVRLYLGGLLCNIMRQRAF